MARANDLATASIKCVPKTPAGADVALALGSGGARGLAHIGAVKALLELGARPVAVAGTSMGAIVGAALAAGAFGKLADTIQSLDIGDAARLFLDFSFSKSGIVKGRRVMEFLSSVIPDTTFDSLDIPFAAMATDIDTGEPVTISRGRILPAVRASIAIPGFFTPVKRGQRILVDGGLSSPVPVAAARMLAKAPVVAVNVDNPGVCPYESRRLPTVVNRAIGMHDRIRMAFRGRLGIESEHGIGFIDMLNKTTLLCERRIAGLEVGLSRPEWLVEPPVGDIPTLDFSRVDDAIRAGYEWTMRRFGR